MTSRRFSALILVSAIVFSPGLAPPAAAWGVVYDPTNYAQNVLQAARALEQISNQVQSLQNEAQMLINQARNLAHLPHYSLQQLQAQFNRTQSLLRQAQRIAYDVQTIEDTFQQLYEGADVSVSDQALVDGARERWSNSVAAFEDAMATQATVVGNIDGTRSEMQALVSASQNATGVLQAAQAGNQLVALQSQQIADLIALLAAQSRAATLEAARQAAAEEQAREQLRRFLEPSTGYQPETIRLFQQ